MRSRRDRRKARHPVKRRAYYWDTPDRDVAKIMDATLDDANDNSILTVRIIVKIRPDEYDKLFRRVREIGSTWRTVLSARDLNGKLIERPDGSEGGDPQVE